MHGKLSELQAAAGRGRADQIREEGGSRNAFRAKVIEQFREFLDRDNPRMLRVYNPAQFDVWQQPGGMFNNAAAMGSLSLLQSGSSRINSNWRCRPWAPGGIESRLFARLSSFSVTSAETVHRTVDGASLMPSTGPTLLTRPSTGPTLLTRPSTGPTLLTRPSTGPTLLTDQPPAGPTGPTLLTCADTTLPP